MAKSIFLKECTIMNTTKSHGIPYQVMIFSNLLPSLSYLWHVCRLFPGPECNVYRHDSCMPFNRTVCLSLKLNQNDNGVNRTNCDTNYNSNSGCDVIEWSRASYGPYFEAQGGGVLAMKWDENDISVCEQPLISFVGFWSKEKYIGSFFRAAIPADVTAGTPSPSSWGAPSAMLRNTQCDITKYFAWHSIVFGASWFLVSCKVGWWGVLDITFCGLFLPSHSYLSRNSFWSIIGDWAGNSYATTNCPGTCDERVVDPANFVVRRPIFILIQVPSWWHALECDVEYQFP